MNIKHINSLWNNTRVWDYVFLVADGKTNVAKKLFDYIPPKYKGTSIEYNMFEFEKTEIQQSVIPEFENWEEYKEYIDSFPQNVKNVLYELDLFDTVVLRKFMDV